MLNLGPGGERGPYLVTQTGVSPNDPLAKERMFVLRPDGRWVDFNAYVCQGKPEAMDEIVFSTTTEIMIPLLVGAAGWVYGRNIWVSPFKVLAVIAQQQFLPLLIGVALMYFAPAFSTKIRSPLNLIGNALLMVTLIVLLVKMGPALTEVSPWRRRCGSCVRRTSPRIPRTAVRAKPTRLRCAASAG